MPIFVLGHGLLAAVAAACAFLHRDFRPRPLRAVALVGIGLAVAAALELASGTTWRGADPVTDRVWAGTAAIGAAWLVAAANAGDRWRQSALVGVVCAGLGAASLTRWSVAFVLPWLAAGVALWTLAGTSPRRGRIRFALAVSDLLTVGALVWQFAEAGRWTLPVGAAPLASGLLMGAAAIRCGAGGLVWHALDRRVAPIVPLLVGGGFVVLPAAVPQPLWVGAALLVVAAFAGARALVAHDLPSAAVAMVVVATALAVAVAVPEMRAAGGATATLAVAALALWPAAPGGGAGERGLAVVMAALTVALGGGVSAAGDGVNVASPTAAGDLARAAFVVLLVVSTTIVTLVAALVARSAAPRHYDIAAVTATRVVSMVMVAGFVAIAWAVGGDGSPFSGLHLAAVAVGAYVAVSMPPTSLAGWRRALRTTRRAPEARAFAAAAVVLELAAVAAAGWLTIAGLRVGFL